jgi:hypothetical protein
MLALKFSALKSGPKVFGPKAPTRHACLKGTYKCNQDDISHINAISIAHVAYCLHRTLDLLSIGSSLAPGFLAPDLGLRCSIRLQEPFGRLGASCIPRLRPVQPVQVRLVFLFRCIPWCSAGINLQPRAQAQALAPTFGRKRKRLHQPGAQAQALAPTFGRKRKRLHQPLAASASACTNRLPQAQALAPTFGRE